jgi:hypothetical protein
MRLGLDRGLAFEDSEPSLTSAAVAGLSAIRVDDPCRLTQIVAANLSTISDLFSLQISLFRFSAFFTVCAFHEYLSNILIHE